MTALMMAAERGHEAVAKLLLDHNAQMDFQSVVSTSLFIYLTTLPICNYLARKDSTAVRVCCS